MKLLSEYELYRFCERMDRKNENHDGEIKDRKKLRDDGSPEKSS